MFVLAPWPRTSSVSSRGSGARSRRALVSASPTGTGQRSGSDGIAGDPVSCPRPPIRGKRRDKLVVAVINLPPVRPCVVTAVEHGLEVYSHRLVAEEEGDLDGWQRL